jgi:hypothetical protein
MERRSVKHGHEPCAWIRSRVLNQGQRLSAQATATARRARQETSPGFGVVVHMSSNLDVMIAFVARSLLSRLPHGCLGPGSHAEAPADQVEDRKKDGSFPPCGRPSGKLR